MKNMTKNIFTHNAKSEKRGIKRWILAFSLASCMICTSCGVAAKADEMRLRKIEGTVGVADGDGKEISPKEAMELYSGYGMDTAEKSYAWIATGSGKLIKMDEESRIKIQKEDKKLQIHADSGKLFFNISESLKEDETMEIHASAMAVGIRGGSGWVYAADETHLSVYILEGSAQCSITDPESNESAEMEVAGGETASLALNPEAADGSRCEVKKETFSAYGIPLFVMRELLEDEELRGKIADAAVMEISSDSTPVGYMNIGEGYIGNGNYEDAIEILNMALEEDSTLAKAYALRGDAHIIIGETQENLETARADYEAALGIEQGTPEAYLGIADIHIRKGEYDEALDVLKKGLDKSGNNQKIADKIAEFESGNITDSQKRFRRLSGYNVDGNLAWYLEYAYDEKGRESRVVSRDAAGVQTGSVDVLYDEHGRCIQRGSYNTDGTVYKVTYEYDETGRIVRNESYTSDGALNNYTAYEYESERDTIKAFGADGTLQGITIATKDADGRRIKDEIFSPDGTLSWYITREYDAEGNMVKDSVYDKDARLISYSAYEYDDNGKRVSEQRFKGDQKE